VLHALQPTSAGAQSVHVLKFCGDASICAMSRCSSVQHIFTLSSFLS
jgi:hypothetical protein